MRERCISQRVLFHRFSVVVLAMSRRASTGAEDGGRSEVREDEVPQLVGVEPLVGVSHHDVGLAVARALPAKRERLWVRVRMWAARALPSKAGQDTPLGNRGGGLGPELWCGSLARRESFPSFWGGGGGWARRCGERCLERAFYRELLPSAIAVGGQLEDVVARERLPAPRDVTTSKGGV